MRKRGCLILILAAVGSVVLVEVSARILRTLEWHFLYFEPNLALVKTVTFSIWGSVKRVSESETFMTGYMRQAGLKPGRWFLVWKYRQPFFRTVCLSVRIEFSCLSVRASKYARRLEGMWLNLFCHGCAQIFGDYCAGREAILYSGGGEKEKLSIRDKAYLRVDALYVEILLLRAFSIMM